MATGQQLHALKTDPRLSPYIIPDSCVRLTGRQLGIGSYGSVEEVEVHGLLCAGKKMHDALVHGSIQEGTDNLVTRYFDECKLLADLQNPRIVRFLGLYFPQGSSLPILLMEKLDTCLDDVLTEYDQAKPDRAMPDIPLCLKVSILLDVVKGLQFLHTRTPNPVVHRDLSAKNILLDAMIEAKISDLGNSRFISTQLYQTLTQNPGCAVYMPPESTGQYGPSLDIFSFGHLALYTVIQVFPCDLLPTKYVDEGSTGSKRPLARTELDRRRNYITMLHRKLRPDHPLVKLIESCLDDVAKDRPPVVEVLRHLEEVHMEDPYKNMTRLEILRTIEAKRDEIETTMCENSALREMRWSKDRELAAIKKELAAKVREVAELNQYLAAKVGEIATKEQQLAARSQEIAALKNDLAAKEEQQTTSNRQILARDQELAARNQELAARSKELGMTKKDLASRKQDLSRMAQDIAAKDRQLFAQSREIAAKKQEFALKDETLAAKEHELADRNRDLATKDKTLSAKDRELAIKSKELAAMNEKVATTNQQLGTVRQELASKEQELASKDQVIAAKDNELAARAEDLGNKGLMLAAKEEELAAVRRDLATMGHALAAKDEELAAMPMYQELAIKRMALVIKDEELATAKKETSGMRLSMKRTVPDYKTQKDEIHAAVLHRSLEKGDTWYLVDMRWIKQWRKFVGYDQSDQSSAGSEPGPIDNSKLFKSADSDSLKDFLMENLDYSLLPEPAWNKLHAWYGLSLGSRVIARTVVEHGLYMEQLKVEVYLLEFKLCLHPNNETVTIKSFSRADTVAFVEKVLRETFSIPEEVECRVWHRYMTHHYELLNKPELTLQDIGLYSGQIIVLEKKNADGTWPRVAVETPQGIQSTDPTGATGVTGGHESYPKKQEPKSTKAKSHRRW